MAKRPAEPTKGKYYPIVIAVVGPTASGKTELAARLAKRFDGQLISADSRQVYRGLNIGTGKEKSVSQLLIDIRQPMESYSVADWQKEASAAIKTIWQADRLPIIVGGTGLYITALLEGYNFNHRHRRSAINSRHAIATKHTNNPPNWRTLLIGPSWPRTELYRRIEQRLDARLVEGMVDEVKTLIAAGVDKTWLSSLGLEYRYTVTLLDGRLSEDQFKVALKAAIRQYARRQLAWWRHHGTVHWVSDYGQAELLINGFLSGDRLDGTKRLKANGLVDL